MVRPNIRLVSAEAAKTTRFRVLYYFMSTHDFQIGAPAVAGIGAPPVPSRRTRLSPMPTPFGYMFYDKTEIDSESCEVTVVGMSTTVLTLLRLETDEYCTNGEV